MTREQFDTANKELWDELSAVKSPEALRWALAYTELLNRKLFGPRKEDDGKAT